MEAGRDLNIDVLWRAVVMALGPRTPAQWTGGNTDILPTAGHYWEDVQHI